MLQGARARGGVGRGEGLRGVAGRGVGWGFGPRCGVGWGEGLRGEAGRRVCGGAGRGLARWGGARGGVGIRTPGAGWGGDSSRGEGCAGIQDPGTGWDGIRAPARGGVGIFGVRWEIFYLFAAFSPFG